MFRLEHLGTVGQWAPARALKVDVVACVLGKKRLGMKRLVLLDGSLNSRPSDESTEPLGEGSGKLVPREIMNNNISEPRVSESGSSIRGVHPQVAK